jgi:hypothetical protein
VNTQITEFQQRAASAAVVKMLGGKHFSICDLDSIAKTIGGESALAGKDYAALKAVHCMDWADMGPDLTRMVKEKCLELLGLPPIVVDEVKPEHKTSQSEKASKLRLAFWRNAA